MLPIKKINITIKNRFNASLNIFPVPVILFVSLYSFHKHLMGKKKLHINFKKPVVRSHRGGYTTCILRDVGNIKGGERYA